MDCFIIPFIFTANTMKHVLIFFSLFIGHASFSQKIESFYTFDWDSCSNYEARYYAILERTDSGWFRKDYSIGTKQLIKQGLYADRDTTIKNGTFYYFHGNGILASLEKWVHGKREGVCLAFHSNKMMADSAYYKNGRVFNKRFRWHRNGIMADSITYVSDTAEVHVSWFDDGGMASAGYMVHGKQYGKWQYFHHNGKIAALEVYEFGDLLSAEYFDEKGKPQGDEELTDRPALFKEGADGWQKYLDKRINWPPGYNFSTYGKVPILLAMEIDEKGKITDAEVITPYHPQFDRISLLALKRSPDWYPAISHNRKIKTKVYQTITFEEKRAYD